MKQIYVTMRDDWTDELVNRVIDITNFTLHTGFIPCVERQAEILKQWIKERANDQHDTSLTLVSWYVK